MKWIRRLHLYAGLLLFPWILLYGLTACFFNHPDWFSDRPAEILHLGALPSAEKLAEQIAADIGTDPKHKDSDKGVRLVSANGAAFTRSLQAQATTADGQNWFVTVNLTTGETTIRSRNPKPEKNKGPVFTQTKVTTPEAYSIEQLKTRISEALTASRKECTEVQIQTLPEVEFQLEAEGQIWDVKYQPQRGTMTARAADAPSTMSIRNFMLRLHTAHGYPSEKNVRWFWAIIVDVMFVAMVFWGISGLFMWWQLKAQRRLGVALLIISAVLATWLSWGMHTLLTK